MQFLFSCEIFHLNWMIKVNHYLVELGNWCRNCSLKEIWNCSTLFAKISQIECVICNITSNITMICSGMFSWPEISSDVSDITWSHWGRGQVGFILETILKYFCASQIFLCISSSDWQLVYQSPLSDHIALEHNSTVDPCEWFHLIST